MVIDNPYKDDEDIYQLNEEGEGSTGSSTYDEPILEESTATVSDSASGSDQRDEQSFFSKFKKQIIVLILLVAVSVAGFIVYQQVKNWFPRLKPRLTSVVSQDIPKKEGSVFPFVSDLKMDRTGQRPTVIVAQPQFDESLSKPGSVDQLHQTTQQASEQLTALSAQILNLQKENQKLVTNLQSQQVQGQMHVNALTDQLAELKSGLNVLDNTIAQLSKKIQDNQKLEKVLATYREEAQQRKDQKIRQTRRYFVQAVIPGRAWLKAADGTAQTVAVGDSVPGYGKVVAIDSLSGIVSTSSGLKIYYGMSSE